MSVRSSLPPSSSAGGGGENLYSLKWNHYQSYLTKGLAQLLNEEYSMTDVTLACEGQFIQAHKVALAVCSPFFKEYFKTYRMEKSGGLIVLANVKFKDLKNLIQFIYHGEVNVRNADLSSFLRTANDLKIEGLADATKPDEGDNSLTRPNPNELKVQPSTSSASDPPSAHRLPSTSSSQSTSNSGGGPPLKRSRLSAPPGHRTGSPISVQNQNLNLSSASSSLAANSSESTAAVPIVDHSQSTTDAVQLPHQDEYDPLGMEDEQEEEMISFDEVKSEPIAVYSLNDEEDNSLSHHGGDALSGSMGNESSGMMYQDFNTSMSQQSAPGPSTASFQAHHRMQPGPSGPKPPAKPSESLVDLARDDVDDIDEDGLLNCSPLSAIRRNSTSTGRSDSPTARILNDIFSLTNSRESGGSSQSHLTPLAPPLVGGAVGSGGGGALGFLGDESRPVCTFCGKDFKNRNTLNNHTSVYHREEKRRMKN